MTIFRRRGQLDGDRHAGAGPGARHVDRSAVELDQATHQREAYTEPAFFATHAFAVALIEKFEDVRELVRRQSGAAILHLQDGSRRFLGHGHGDERAGRAVGERIDEQVDDDLLDPRRIAFHPDRLAATFERVLRGAAGRAHRRDGIARTRVEIQRLMNERDLAGDRASHLEQIVDHPPQVLGLAIEDVERDAVRRRSGLGGMQQGHRVGDCRERIAQLMPQHRKELVFRPVGLLRVHQRGVHGRAARHHVRVHET
jgi:hypothetical protein